MAETQDRVVYWGTGRRKSAIARVRLVPGEGKVVVNGKPGEDYFNRIPSYLMSLKGPLEILGFETVREKEHISMVRENPDGSKTPLTMPNHPKIKASTLRTICTQCGITRDDFLTAYRKA